ELDKYLRLEPQDTQEPIQWWRDHKPTVPITTGVWVNTRIFCPCPLSNYPGSQR
ncbi:hypothetical protein IWW34DRAFT_769080, partial [Fusarium oxysporum f. sp. albedinis]